MDKKALEQLLGQLHSELAQSLLAKVRSGEATASDLNVARQFLKDNGIDGNPKKGTPLGELADELPSFEDDEDTPALPN